MWRVIWMAAAEAVVVAGAVGGLWFGPRVVDRLVGYPPADERLIVAAGATGRAGEGEFEAALAAGASVRARDEYGTTALMLAATSGDVGKCRRLLDLGADVGAADGLGRTALDRAAANGRAAVVELLVRAGARRKCGGGCNRNGPSCVVGCDGGE